jgi:branched-chain amino acid transport system ATP-binding protein
MGRVLPAMDMASSGTADGQQPVLRLIDVSVRFGGIVALDRVSFDVRRGEICGLIGPNGAGKTTIFNCLSRLYPCEGEIELNGRPLSGAGAHQVAALGIGRTFQNLALFGSMTVLENVMLGAHCRTRTSYLEHALRLPSVEREEKRLAARVGTIVRTLGLEAEARRPVVDLPFGIRKRVELARALAAEPKILLLDEPAGGLNHEEVGELRDLVRRIRDEHRLTVLLVEHHMDLVMRVSDRVVALEFGRKIAEGTPAEVKTHPDVVRAYLGAAR